MALFELSSETYKNGRRPFTAILYELQPPECVVDDVGTKFNDNGITFLEEYCAPQLESIKDMSVTVSFVDEERTVICDHGDTGVEDGMPVFDNATVVGHFTEKGYITDIEIDGETKRVVAAKGYLDEMRYHSFVQWLESELSQGRSAKGSIEIYKSKGNKTIIYKKGYLPQGRIPTEFIHSGWSMVISPADSTSALIELNTQNKAKKEENAEMEFNMDEIKSVIAQTISETNSKNDELSAQVAELNAQIAEKDNTISELNATVEQVKKAIADLEAEHEDYWAEREALQKELGELKAEKRLAELNAAIADYTEDEVKYAESEINSFKENPLEGDIEAITSKICVGIVSKQKEDAAHIAEQNSKNKNNDVIDIFSDMGSDTGADNSEDVEIF